MTELDVTLTRDLQALVDPSTRGDPQSPLRWTSKSLRQLQEGLALRGHKVSRMTIGKLLAGLGFSMQATRKVTEGRQHPDRDAQFQYISDRAKAFMHAGQPVISVDTKKKELGKVAPYGVYDVAKNEGWVSVGTDHDTAAFAVETISRWWREMGRTVYPNAKRLLITADGGGSNSSRTWLWKHELQKFADLTDLSISVCHYPPGTSKWNKIEHRMFCHITRNWRGRPLENVETIVSLIGATKTKTGLRIRAKVDSNSYPTGVKVSDADIKRIRLRRDTFHGDWNYALGPELAHP